MGWFSAGGSFTGINPARLLDTRAATCGVRLEPGETRTISIAGQGGVPATGIGAVALNVTVTAPSQTSYITVWPTGGNRPNTSNLNMTEGQTVPNMVTVGLGAAGQVSFFNAFGTVDLLVDVMGYFAGDTPGGSPVDCPPVVRTFTDGTHVVGHDVPPGRYVTTTPTSGCYWERTKGFSGSLDDVIANDIGDGQRIVDIKPGDVGFDSSRCGTWRTFVASNYSPSTSFGTGVYAVGSQITPGRYQTTGTTNCYWARLRGFAGTLNEIIANDLGSGTLVVDISASDVGIESSGCGLWVLVA
jgi:hypothetical protein